VAALITAATGRRPYFVGKPNPMMFRSAHEPDRRALESRVMVGDRMDTDIAPGIEAGWTPSWCSPGRRRRPDLERYPSVPGGCSTRSRTPVGADLTRVLIPVFGHQVVL